MKVSKLQCVLLLPAQDSYKALIDCQQSDKILALTNGANVELEPIWATLLAKALEGKNVKELLSNVGSGGGAPAAGSGAPAAGGAAPAAEAPKVEAKKEEEKEESDDDMVRLGFAFCGCMFGMVLMFDLSLCRVSVCSINCTVFIMYMSFSTSSHISLAKNSFKHSYHYCRVFVRLNVMKTGKARIDKNHQGSRYPCQRFSRTFHPSTLRIWK